MALDSQRNKLVGYLLNSEKSNDMGRDLTLLLKVLVWAYILQKGLLICMVEEFGLNQEE